MMFLKMKNLLKIIFLFVIVNFISVSAENHKYKLWQVPSFFRGFNVLTNQSHKLKDFSDLKATGANFAQIGIDGFYDVDPPYNYNSKNVEITDSFVSYCNTSGIYYSLTLRSGPGRRDVYLESEAGQPKSTIWKNRNEQMLYGHMLREIVDRYKNDTLFVGIGLMVEPNPLFDSLQLNAISLLNNLSRNGIDFKLINQTFIDSVRIADSEIPILVQNYQYSCPEFFSISNTYKDDFYIYEFHSYRPVGYVKTTVPNSVTYPGSFISLSDLAFKYFDKNFFLTNVFNWVDSIGKVTGRPIFMGEFGLMLEQNGGTKFLTDMYEICIAKGWHFGVWDYRAGRARGEWDYERKSPEYWQTVLNMFIRKPDDVQNKAETSKQTTLSIVPAIANERIKIEINSDSPQSLGIFSITGCPIADLTPLISNENKIINYNLSSIPDGIYIIRLKSNKSIEVNRFIIIR